MLFNKKAPEPIRTAAEIGMDAGIKILKINYDDDTDSVLTNQQIACASLVFVDVIESLCCLDCVAEDEMLSASVFTAMKKLKNFLIEVFPEDKKTELELYT